MGEREDKDNRLVLKGVPEQLHRRFKASCAAKGTNMSQRVILLLQLDVQHDLVEQYMPQIYD